MEPSREMEPCSEIRYRQIRTALSKKPGGKAGPFNSLAHFSSLVESGQHEENASNSLSVFLIAKSVSTFAEYALDHDVFGIESIQKS
jgi:hypothetical protein